MPCLSNVMRVSIVGLTSPVFPFFLSFDDDREELTAAAKSGLVASMSSGAKAEANRCEMRSGSQVVVMLSGKKGESITKTSEEERRPRSTPDLASSRLRVGPRPSASPVVLFQRMLAFVWEREGCGRG